MDLRTMPPFPGEAASRDAEGHACASEFGRAERLLDTMRQVLSHDLPNQLVVVLGLAKLLEAEEKETLSPQAQECLTMLTSAAQRASGMVQFLKDTARQGWLQKPREVIHDG